MGDTCFQPLRPSLFSDPSSLCTLHLLTFPNSQALWWTGHLARWGLCLPRAGSWAGVSSALRRVAQAAGLQASTAAAGVAAGPSRRRAHTCISRPPAPSTPGGRPPAALGHTPPARPRRVPASPSCSPGAQMAGTRPCALSTGCSAPKGSAPARTGWAVVSGGPRQPVPTPPPARWAQAPPLPTPPAPSHQLDQLQHGPGLQHLGQQHVLGFTQFWGDTLGQRGSGRPRWESPPPCPHLLQPGVPSPASASSR